MFADSFDYRTAAGLHRDRLNEAESIRRANAAKKAVRTADENKRLAEQNVTVKLKQRIGKQLIAIGEKMTA